MTKQPQDPKGLKNSNQKQSRADLNSENREITPSDELEEQVLNEEEQQLPINPTDTEGDARGAFLDLHGNYGPGDNDDDDDENDEDAGVSDPGTEIDIPFPDSDDDADDTTRKIPSF